MPLKPFTYPLPETRFFHAGTSVYKFKFRYGNIAYSEDEENKDCINKELEQAIRAVLGNVNNLQPFATKHFIIFPYKSKWESVSKLKFKHGNTFLVPYPYIFIMYVEINSFQQDMLSEKEAGSPQNSVKAEQQHENKERESILTCRRMQEPAKCGHAEPSMKRAGPEISTCLLKEQKPWAEQREGLLTDIRFENYHDAHACNCQDMYEPLACNVKRKIPERQEGHTVPLQQQNHKIGDTECSQPGSVSLMQFFTSAFFPLWQLFGRRKSL
ncbi:membrane-anchored junction protein isoform X2 [Rhinatrema bivittatum]|uniref:membrane-anchored junction protein isoform X2 n=1 Tax=Rhinatrema bivittatum TaxID=194408 RepID=UPI00112D29B5|nr:membrane-anchored junction protein isoform X2 [Rhinatrema bivittatum]